MEEHKREASGGEVVWVPENSSRAGGIPSDSVSEIFKSFLVSPFLSPQFKPSAASSSDLLNHPGHNNQGEENSSDHRPRPFGCPYCHKHFLRRHHLQQHIRLHTGERPFVCTNCNKDFVQQSSLISHSRLCSNTLPNQQDGMFSLSSQPPA